MTSASSAHSVGSPRHCSLSSAIVGASGSRRTSLSSLVHTESSVASSSARPGLAAALSRAPKAAVLCVSASLVGSSSTSASAAARTLILPVVSVPVLSAQIVVAAPIASHASTWRTSSPPPPSRSIRDDETARASVSARGSPSGTATASTAIDVRRYSISACGSAPEKPKPATHIAPKHSAAAAAPARPICTTSASSFVKSGDEEPPSSASSSSSPPSPPGTAARTLPMTECAPTATTSIRPEPATALVPERMKGEWSGSLATGSGLPVSADSSILTSLAARSSPSHGIEARLCALNASTSPTTMSRSFTSICRPSRTTTFLLDDSSFAASSSERHSLK